MLPTKALWEAVSQHFKRSNYGLFQGRMKQYGNNVPFSKHKTRRTWLPNVQQKRVQSEALGEAVRLKLTTRALRTIEKKGGLDNYLRTASPEFLGHTGMKLRHQILRKELEIQGSSEKTFPLVPPLKVQGVTFRNPPNLETARVARQKAAEWLGKKEGELASVAETIQYLQHTTLKPPPVASTTS